MLFNKCLFNDRYRLNFVLGIVEIVVNKRNFFYYGVYVLIGEGSLGCDEFDKEE